jgi:hypothetical protein
MRVSSPGLFHNSAYDEMVMITDYRSRIGEAIGLLDISFSYHRPPEYMAEFEMPTADSILPLGVTPTMFASMGEMGVNYHKHISNLLLPHEWW